MKTLETICNEIGLRASISHKTTRNGSYSRQLCEVYTLTLRLEGRTARLTYEQPVTDNSTPRPVYALAILAERASYVLACSDASDFARVWGDAGFAYSLYSDRIRQAKALLSLLGSHAERLFNAS